MGQKNYLPNADGF